MAENEDIWEKARLQRLDEAQENKGLFGKSREELIADYLERLNTTPPDFNPLPQDPVVERRTLVDFKGRQTRRRGR